jgi:hypothetical protein
MSFKNVHESLRKGWIGSTGAGLALVSMAINLIQAQIVTKVRWVAKEVGMTTDDQEPKIPIEYLRIQAKKQNTDIMQTPEDNFGKVRTMLV